MQSPTSNEASRLVASSSIGSWKNSTSICSESSSTRSFQHPSRRSLKSAVVEVSPSYDGPGQITAIAAADVLHELLALRAVAG